MTADEATSEKGITEFLETTGAVELLCEIDAEGSLFSRLAEELSVSRTTLTARLDEGQSAGLIETIEVSGRGTSHAYVLSERGTKLRFLLNQSGLTEIHRQLKHLHDEFDRKRANVERAVTSQPDWESVDYEWFRDALSADNER